MAMHGPHQGAQKSTTRGRSLRVRCLSKLAAVSSMGLPSNSAKWHFGQRGASFKRSLGKRTTESQCPQTTWIPSFIISPRLFGLSDQDGKAIGNDTRRRVRLLLGRRRPFSQSRGGQGNLVGGRIEYHGARAHLSR